MTMTSETPRAAALPRISFDTLVLIALAGTAGTLAFDLWGNAIAPMLGLGGLAPVGLARAFLGALGLPNGSAAGNLMHLFLVGVIFFLYRAKDILVYVSWFTLGHSSTLLLGVLADIQVSAYLVDAIIGLSVVYKGFDNLGGFQRWLGRQPSPRKAVLIFGFFHGFGLATKVQELVVRDDMLLLVGNMLAFNVGVEIGQLIALGLILSLLMWWRRHPSYMKHAYLTNTLLMAAGFAFFGMQMTGFFLEDL